MTAYYNEIDPFAAEWLRELIKAGTIAPGEVDTRSIADVTPDDLHGFTQCHFFAGIGGWSYALRLAGWTDDRPVWTGSCPCQSFSAAGKGLGFADTRHLWPVFFNLIRQCRPVTVFGEQVDQAIRHGWLDLVQDDLEGEGYAVGAVVFPSCGIGAPHIRKRLYWVADSTSPRRDREEQTAERDSRDKTRVCLPGEEDGVGRLANTNNHGRNQGRECVSETWDDGANGNCAAGRLADSECDDWRSDQQGGRQEGRSPDGRDTEGTARLEDPGPTNGFWRVADWLLCRDGRWRPVKPTIFPLAHGIPNRVGTLRGAGNAIVPQQAAEFIEAVMEY